MCTSCRIRSARGETSSRFPMGVATRYSFPTPRDPRRGGCGAPYAAGASVIRKALAGAVAGLVASWAMETFQAAWTTKAAHVERGRIRTDLPQYSAAGGERSTLRVARAVAEPMPDQ